VAAVVVTAGLAALPSAGEASDGATNQAGAHEPATPVRHVVVVFQENVSFDHYFGTYPKAANADGQPFHARRDTPAPDGLRGPLLTANPNGVNPARYSPAHDEQLVSCDQGHDYTQEQQAFDGGAMDRFPVFTGNSTGTNPVTKSQCNPREVMNYYDGNTVTALWNYAQHFAMSDASFGTTFGPSTPGALNLIAGNTHGVDPGSERGNLAGELSSDGQTVIGDPQPALDDCSTRDAVSMSQDATHGRNVGDLLNGAGLSWGFFQGGFRPTSAYAGPGTKAVCNGPAATHNVGAALGGTGKTGAKPYGTKGDYIAHHQPFQYYASTANPHHLPPSSAAAIGTTDQANHQYDLSDFTAALQAGHLPAVSFVKAAGFQDGHAGYSDPIDEQRFLVGILNALQGSEEWRSTAVFIAYDDSDGWYDHRTAIPLVANPSSDAAFDALTGPGHCGSGPSLGGYTGRCGYGPRLPLLVISPFAKANFVDHTQTDQSSLLRFIEDNWSLGRLGDGSFDERAGSLTNLFDFGRDRRPALMLDPATGQPWGGEGSGAS
jgi:phospholipase C